MDDTISRQAAIDALIRKMKPHDNGEGTMTIYVMSERLVKETLNDLPVAQQERCEDCENFSKTRLLIPQPTQTNTSKALETLDCISRQAAIDALYHVDENNGWSIEAIRGLPSAEPEQRWIPCSERLPEEESDILVTYVEKDEKRIVPVNYGRGTWFDCVFNIALNPVGVLAWMPLPERYRGERREE